MQDKTIPPVVLIYGLAGLIPFLATPLVSALVPGSASDAGWWQAVYGATILSFLGGARWGQAVQRARPDPVTVSLAMLPSIFAWGALLLVPRLGLRGALLALLAALVAHWFWDARSTGLPRWYPRLRSLLTGGAAAGMVAQAALL